MKKIKVGDKVLFRKYFETVEGIVTKIYGPYNIEVSNNGFSHMLDTREIKIKG